VIDKSPINCASGKDNILAEQISSMLIPLCVCKMPL